MGSMEGKTDKIRQILADAGCDAEEIEAFIDCHRSSRRRRADEDALQVQEGPAVQDARGSAAA